MLQGAMAAFEAADPPGRQTSAVCRERLGIAPEDLLSHAVARRAHDARRKAELAMQEKMQALTGGLGLPPGLGLG